MIRTYVVRQLQNGTKVCYWTHDTNACRFVYWLDGKGLIRRNFYQSFCVSENFSEIDLKIYGNAVCLTELMGAG